MLPITMPAIAPFEGCEVCLLPGDTVALEEEVMLALALDEARDNVENGVGSAMPFP
jgi:hypothetical protein